MNMFAIVFLKLVSKVMEKLTGLNKTDVTEISKQISDAFYDYKYNEDDLGLVVFPI